MYSSDEVCEQCLYTAVDEGTVVAYSAMHWM